MVIKLNRKENTVFNGYDEILADLFRGMESNVLNDYRPIISLGQSVGRRLFKAVVTGDIKEEEVYEKIEKIKDETIQTIAKNYISSQLSLGNKT
jgi:hypothetical protein